MEKQFERQLCDGISAGYLEILPKFFYFNPNLGMVLGHNF
jgi:hypothetical protein